MTPLRMRMKYLVTDMSIFISIVLFSFKFLCSLSLSLRGWVRYRWLKVLTTTVKEEWKVIAMKFGSEKSSPKDLINIDKKKKINQEV